MQSIEKYPDRGSIEFFYYFFPDLTWTMTIPKNHSKNFQNMFDMIDIKN